jgi:hypothetical protein
LLIFRAGSPEKSFAKIATPRSNLTFPYSPAVSAQKKKIVPKKNTIYLFYFTGIIIIIISFDLARFSFGGGKCSKILLMEWA